MLKKTTDAKKPQGKRLKVEELATKTEVSAKSQVEMIQATTNTTSKVTLKSFYEVGKIVSTTVGVSKS
jgi:hypothetical protein